MKTPRLRNVIYFAGAVGLILVFARLQLWLVGGLIVLAMYTLIQLRRHPGLRKPEGSVRLRQLTFLAQALSIIAAAYATEQIWFTAILSILILAAGHYTAYRVRNKPPVLMRIAAVIALHLAFVWMFYALSRGLPVPQAQIAMLAMAIVSFELFSRLNLFSGMGIGLLNLYVAATLSRDLAFGAFLVIFLGLLMAFFWQADSEDGVRDNPVILRPMKKSSPKNICARWHGWAIRFGVSALIFTPVVFLVTPHYAGHPIVPPVSFQVPFSSGPSSSIINPAIPLVQLQGMPQGQSEYYAGFDSQLNLAYRGGLSDSMMMYVRSPARSYWRSNAYDFYDGQHWSQPDSQLTIVNREGPAFILWDLNWRRQDYFVQTYYIVRDLPNRILTAGRPVQLYLAANQIAWDSNGALRLGQPLRANTTYSLLSLRTDYSDIQLRSVESDIKDDSVQRAVDLAPYLQLSNTVTGRTRQLALDLTKDAPTRYDKVLALRDYLRNTYPYNYYPPAQRPGTDAVDQFLFEDKQGVCEQYVSAMVIMLRELGIPARLTAGFGSGTYNAVTGYYEVHANDAHAWAEVYFPRYGWVPFDPTGGWTGDPNTGPVQRWVFSSLFENVAFPSIPLRELANTGGAILGTVSGPFVAILVLILTIFLCWRLRKLIRQYDFGVRLLTRHDPERRQIFAAYRRAQRRVKSYRSPAQTVREHATAHPELADLAEVVETAAYQPGAIDKGLLDRIMAWRRQ